MQALLAIHPRCISTKLTSSSWGEEGDEASFSNYACSTFPMNQTREKISRVRFNSEDPHPFLHKDEALLCTQIKSNSSQVTSTSVIGGSLCLPVCTVSMKLLCKFQQPAQNKPKLSLDGFISHLLQAQTTSIEERK